MKPKSHQSRNRAAPIPTHYSRIVHIMSGFPPSSLVVGGSVVEHFARHFGHENDMAASQCQPPSAGKPAERTICAGDRERHSSVASQSSPMSTRWSRTNDFRQSATLAFLSPSRLGINEGKGFRIIE
jgi:hypothetical protein